MKHIEVAAQKRLEVATDAWWDSLDKKQQDKYIKDHPNSKYAKKSKKNTGTPTPSKPKKALTLEQKKRKSKMAKSLRRIRTTIKDNMKIPGYPELQEQWGAMSAKAQKIRAELKSPSITGAQKDEIYDRLDRLSTELDRVETRQYYLVKEHEKANKARKESGPDLPNKSSDALKMRNAIIRRFAGRSLDLENNPYSTTHRLRAAIKPSSLDKLDKTLVAQDWKKEKLQYTGKDYGGIRYTSKDGLEII